MYVFDLTLYSFLKYTVSYGSTFIFALMDFYMFQSHLLQKQSFLHGNAFSPLSKINCLYIHGSVSDSPCRSSNLFVYCNTSTSLLITELEIRQFYPSTLFFFFKAVLASLGSLHVFVTFRICLEISKNCWHFDWSCTESTDQFGENWHNKTETSIIALHLFRSSFSQQHFMVFQWRGFAHLLLDLPLSISYFWCYYK